MMSSSSGSRTRRATTKEQEGKHVPYGKEGTGFYTLATKGCFDVIGNSTDLCQEAMGHAIEAYKRRNDGKPFTIADYGTADGGTSMPLFAKLLHQLRESLPRDPVVFLYEDQPVNDYNSLFKRMHGIIPTPASSQDDTPMETLLDMDDNVYIMASGTSFYQQVTPDATVDFGYAATAMHWLTSAPCPIPDALHSSYTQDAHAKKMYSDQAHKDLKHIFKLRKNEMKAGAQFVCVNFAKDPDGQFLGHTHKTPSCMHTNFNEIWRGMAREGLITDKEVANTNFPHQYRTEDEHRAVFHDAELSSLSLDRLETRVTPCPFRQSLLAGKIKPKDYARTFVPTTRTWSNSTFRSGLSPKHSEEERDKLVDELFDRYAERISEKPTDHGMDYVHAYFTVSKADH
ncbi:hypothetical protein PTSG_08577 [Salpingoeca rosetta]|uniref:SAM dependent carboxyl methyltransferase n=1 Tax=Salpingoeca rosetta (strain ATCC 50818 / BSB-021) TaxID=946362 RepID=F2UK32_SALR5|nr:uncharacterized protein PTSG_08577 [Salpingoeca rosetta]EGD77481.1 hypothetical protein PTSG_08577 [Salpingoeca rosetta]|eukprot:XP_004990369.1 hypothetical protein PTSG_08577 [Salpingoeca rosetta]